MTNKPVQTVLDIFPLIAPIPTAWAVATSLEKALHWPLPILIIAALVIEFMGFSGADTASHYYEFNRSSQEGEMKAPAWIAYSTFGLYFVVTLGLTLMFEPLAALFPVLSAVGFLLFILRQDQQAREGKRESTRQEAKQAEEERKQERKRKRQERKQTKQLVASVQRSSHGKIGSDASLIAYLRENAGQSQQTIANHFGVSRSAVGQRINKLKESGVLYEELSK